MPQRTTLLQRIVFVAKRNLADTGAVVTESKMLPDLDDGLPCEVDVVIEATVGGEPVVIGLEVKEWSRKLDKNDVAQVIAKHDRLPTNRLVIVSKSGFTKRALAKVAAFDGKVAAVTPLEVELRATSTLIVESFTITAKDIVLVVRQSGGELVRVTAEHGAGIEVYEEGGEVACSVEELVGLLMNSAAARARLGDMFHEEADKDDVWGFSVEIAKFDELPDVPPMFVKWAATNELHRIVGLAFWGNFKGYQSTLDFKGLVLGEDSFGVAQGVMIGRPTVLVARQVDGAQARISWHFLDVPPGV